MTHSPIMGVQGVDGRDPQHAWDRTHSHYLSRKALENEWDVFVFNQGAYQVPAELVLGFSTKLHRNLTQKRLYDWIQVAKDCDDSVRIEICRAEVKSIAILRYRCYVLGTPLSADDTILTPGNYVIESVAPIFHMREPLEMKPMDQFPDRPWWMESLEEKYKDADLRLNSDSSCWIVPPSLGLLLARNVLLNVADRVRRIIEEYQHESNQLKLPYGFAAYFRHNSFAVDIYDGCRIVVLDKNMPTSNLKTINLVTSDEKRQRRFQSHFKRCLQVNMMGGDVRHDYTESVIEDILEGEYEGFLPQDIVLQERDVHELDWRLNIVAAERMDEELDGE